MAARGPCRSPIHTKIGLGLGCFRKVTANGLSFSCPSDFAEIILNLVQCDLARREVDTRRVAKHTVYCSAGVYY